MEKEPMVNRATSEQQELVRIAMEQLVNSYAPYSHFHVAAAALMSSGKIYTGVNVENASYPAGICAERNAIFHAIACGETKLQAIAIVGGSEGTVLDYCPPCGICRQVMREFCDPEQMQVILAKPSSQKAAPREKTDEEAMLEYKIMTLMELLPESFGPDALKN